MDQMQEGMERQSRQPEVGEITKEEILETLTHLRYGEGDEAEQKRTLAMAGMDYAPIADMNARRDWDNPLSQGQAYEKLVFGRNGIHCKFGDEKPIMEKLTEESFTLEELEHGVEIELPSQGADFPFRFGIRKAPGTEGYIFFGVGPWKNEEIRNYVRYIEPAEDGADKSVVFGRKGIKDGEKADWTMPELSYTQSISRQQFRLTVNSEGITLSDLDSLNGTKVAKHTGVVVMQKFGENGDWHPAR